MSVSLSQGVSVEIKWDNMCKLLMHWDTEFNACYLHDEGEDGDGEDGDEDTGCGHKDIRQYSHYE